MKILITDADGTITFGDHSVDKKIIKAIKDFKENDPNNIIVLATGRNLIPTQYILENSGLSFDYYILSNGAIILDKDFEPLKLMPLEVNISEICKHLGTHYRIDTLEEHYFTPSYRTSTNFPMKVVNIINDHQEVEDDKYVISTRVESEKEVEELIRLLSKNNSLQIIRNNFDIDVSALGVDKYEGFLFLKDYLGLGEHTLYAIGDSYNDLSMIKNAHLGASFNYAKEDIQREASLLVDCFSEFVEKIILE